MQAPTPILASILRKITQNPNTYIIFYRPSCPYCQRALDKLRSTKSSYKGYDLNRIEEKYKVSLSQILNFFIEKKDEIEFDPNHSTIPLIFFNSKFIGGNEELQKRLK